MDTIRDIKTVLGISAAELVGYLAIILISALFVVLPVLWNDLGIGAYVSYLESNPTPVIKTYESFNDAINTSRFSADISVFTFWAITGMLAYMLATFIYQTLKSSVVLIEEIVDIPKDRQSIVNEALHTMIIRFFAVGLLAAWAYLGKQYLLGFIIISLRRVVEPNVDIIVYAFALGAVVLMGVWLHGVIALLRMFVMRKRLFLPAYHT